jgi:hypothetical protein
MELIIGLLSGAAGGNAAGKLLGSLDQGTLINSIAGIVGGSILSALGAPDLAGAAGEAGGLDFGAIIGQVVGGGVGGGGLLALVGAARNMMAK